MKNKFIKSVLICVIISSILYACGKEQDQSNDKSSTSDSDQFISLSSIGKSTDDSQSYWNAAGHNFAKGEKGYYFLTSEADYIMYFDEETGDSFPLCGKADCKHNDLTCNAYLKTGTHLSDTIYYYKGYVYIISYEQGDAFLEKVNADGSGRQILCKICKYEGSTGIRLIFHDSSVYITNSGHFNLNTEYTEVIKRFSLDGKSEETIFEYTGMNAKIEYAKSYGDKLFFRIQTYVMDEDKNATFDCLGLYAYDYSTKVTGKVIDENVSDYTIDENNNIIYYFVSGDGLYKLNLVSKEKSKIFQADDEIGIAQLSFDGEYLYVNNLRWAALQASVKKITDKCWVLDNKGTIIHMIPCDNILQLYYGDENYLFGYQIGYNIANFAYINKSNIENVKEWTEINPTIN